MKFLSMLVAAIAILGFGTAHAAPQIGEIAPDFTATDIKGETVKLSDLKGKTVVLEWHNPECPFVIKHYETKNMQGLQSKAAADDVVWVTINTSAAGKEGNLNAETAAKYVADHGASAAHYVLDSDGAIGKAYEAKTTPHMFVIDKEGKLVYAGAIDDNTSPRASSVAGAKNYVAAALESLKAGTAVETTQTQPYGCSVKY